MEKQPVKTILHSVPVPAVESLQTILNAINASPTYTIKEEAYILELHELINEARARQINK